MYLLCILPIWKICNNGIFGKGAGRPINNRSIDWFVKKTQCQLTVTEIIRSLGTMSKYWRIIYINCRLLKNESSVIRTKWRYNVDRSIEAGIHFCFNFEPPKILFSISFRHSVHGSSSFSNSPPFMLFHGYKKKQKCLFRFETNAEFIYCTKSNKASIGIVYHLCMNQLTMWQTQK